MDKGIIKYDKHGNPICEICGKAFKRVLSHVRQKHDMSEREYKLKFGYDLKKGICSAESSQKSREAVFNNYEICIENNLLDHGIESRFQNGHEGRTKDQVSAQTKRRLIKHIKSIRTELEAKEAGVKLGRSGLGNKARWNK